MSKILVVLEIDEQSAVNDPTAAALVAAAVMVVRKEPVTGNYDVSIDQRAMGIKGYRRNLGGRHVEHIFSEVLYGVMTRKEPVDYYSQFGIPQHLVDARNASYSKSSLAAEMYNLQLGMLRPINVPRKDVYAAMPRPTEAEAEAKLYEVQDYAKTLVDLRVLVTNHWDCDKHRRTIYKNLKRLHPEMPILDSIKLLSYSLSDDFKEAMYKLEENDAYWETYGQMTIRKAALAVSKSTSMASQGALISPEDIARCQQRSAEFYKSHPNGVGRIKREAYQLMIGDQAQDVDELRTHFGAPLTLLKSVATLPTPLTNDEYGWLLELVSQIGPHNVNEFQEGYVALVGKGHWKPKYVAGVDWGNKDRPSYSVTSLAQIGQPNRNDDVFFFPGKVNFQPIKLPMIEQQGPVSMETKPLVEGDYAGIEIRAFKEANDKAAEPMRGECKSHSAFVNKQTYEDIQKWGASVEEKSEGDQLMKFFAVDSMDKAQEALSMSAIIAKPERTWFEDEAPRASDDVIASDHSDINNMLSELRDACPTAKPVCTCTLAQLSMSGCTCGAMEAERNAQG